jgi:hypothetical protein
MQRQAEAAYHLFSENPNHPSLRFKRVSRNQPIYSVRIGAHYRAVGYLRDNGMLWIWIGPHAEYDRLITRL